MWEEYRYVEVSLQTSKDKRTRWRRIPREKVGEWIDANPNAKAYFNTIQSFKLSKKDDDEPHWCSFFIDLDADEEKGFVLQDAHDDARFVADNYLKGYEIEPEIWFSGKKGFHILVQGVVYGARPDSKLTYHWHHVATNLAKKLGLKTLDERVYSLPRMWRVSNTIHPGSGLRKTRLQTHELYASLDSILELAEGIRELELDDGEEYEANERLGLVYAASVKEYEDRYNYYTGSEGGTEYDFGDCVPPCVQYLLDNGLAELGTKNRADMALAGYFKTSEMPVKDAVQVIADWARSIPVSLTHVDNVKARVLQSISVLRTVYGDPKYHFSCGSMKATGIDPELCEKCHTLFEAKVKLVHLSDHANAEHHGVRIGTEADVIGKDSKEMIVPSSVTGMCGYDPDSAMCKKCPMNQYFSVTEGACVRTIVFNSKNPRSIELLDIKTTAVNARIKSVFGVNRTCRSFTYEVVWGNAQTIYLASRISEDFNLEDRVPRLKAIYLGHGIDLNSGYRMYGYVYPHPRDLTATFLIDTVEPLQSSLSTFSLTQDELRELEVFRCEHGQSVTEKVAEIHKAFMQNFIFVFGRENVLRAVDMVFHTVRWVKFQGQRIKGWGDSLIVGDTRQGKTDIVKKIMRYYDLGAMASGESSSRTGLLYTIHTVAGEERWIAFGLLCRANGYLVAVDEVHGMNPRDFKEFTIARSEGYVDVHRATYGVASCETRLICIANAKPGMSLSSYGYPVQAIPDIPAFESLEDVSRFDYVVAARAGDIPDEQINQDLEALNPVDNPYTSQLCKNLILWVWTLEPQDIVVRRDTELLILDLAMTMSKEYIPSIPLVEVADVRYKILRLAVAFAARTFSTEDYEKLIVKPEHAEAAYQMFTDLYKSPGLDYWGYSDANAQLYIEPEAVERLVKAFKGFSQWQKVAQWMLNMSKFTKSMFFVSVDISKPEANEILAFMFNSNYLETEKGAIRKTPSGREFLYSLLPHGKDDDF